MRLVVLIPLLLAAAPQQQQPVQSLRPSGIAARINGEVITWDQVEYELKNVNLANRTPDQRKKVLRILAERELFLQEAKNYNIEVSETQVDTSLEAERKRSKFTTQQFQQYINTVLGMSITEYRATIKRDLTIGMLMSRLATEPLRNPNQKIQLLLEFVSPEELREYYDLNKAQFREIRQIDVIFLKLQFGPADKDDKIRLAESIRRRVLEDSPLYAQALAHMDPSLMPKVDKMHAPAYKNLAYAEAPFSDEVKKLLYETMKEGEISEPIVDGNSVSLYELRQKIHERERTFEEAQPLIRRQIELAKRRINQKILLEDLVRRSYVEPPDIFR